MLLAVFLLLFAQNVQPAVNTAPDLNAAIQLAQEGRNAEALAALQKVAAANPNDHMARLWIAKVQDRMGHPDVAEPIYHSIVLEDPGNVDAWVGYGTTLLEQDQISDGLDALRKAEQLAPQNPDVVAALASGYELDGKSAQSITYYQQLASMSATQANVMRLEDARRSYEHRIDLQTFGEDYSGPTPTARGGDIAVDFRLKDTVRVFGRAQLQRKFNLDENREGGGVEWRWTPWGTFSGQVLIGSNDNRVIPQRDYLGSVVYGYRRATYVGTLRYFDFFGANVAMLSPGVTVAVTPRWTVAARYAFTSTDTTTATNVRGNTADLGVARAMAPRIWVRGGYIRGVQSFDTYSIDQVGDFRANTASAGVQILLPSLTSIVGSYQYQWRADGVRMGRVNLAIVQSF
jgi:tetratricopeptide (TPR) repeat protein